MGKVLRLPTAEDKLASRRGEITRQTHDLVRQGGQSLRLLPHSIRDALRCEAWKERPAPSGTVIVNASFLNWVTLPFPRGIEADVDIVRKLIAGDPAALVGFDAAIKAEQVQGRRTDIVHNVHEVAARPAGNSAGAAIRRLRKAADAGDAKAVELLDKVARGEVAPNRAKIEMGWARPTVTVVDEPAAFLDALTRRMLPDEIVRRIAAALSVSDRRNLLVAIATAAWRPRARRRHGAVDAAAQPMLPLWPEGDPQ